MCPQDGPGDTAVGPWPWFRGVGEGEGSGVDDSIIADQRYRDLHRLSHPAPTLPEGGNVRHHTQDTLSTSEQGRQITQDFSIWATRHIHTHKCTSTDIHTCTWCQPPHLQTTL